MWRRWGHFFAYYTSKYEQDIKWGIYAILFGVSFEILKSNLFKSLSTLTVVKIQIRQK